MGVTMAKKSLVLVGERKAVGIAVRNMKVNKRNTMLDVRLKKIGETDGKQ